MAIDLYIPRLEWNEITGLTGTTVNLDPNVTSISSTANLRAGMIVTGSGIQADTRIVSKGPTSIVLSQNATASASGVALTFFERYDFQYPPKKDTEDKRKPQQKKTASLSGIEQIQTDFLEVERELEFGFLTKTDMDLLETIFFDQWAVFGEEFRYFMDKADAAFNNYTLNANKFDRPRQVKKHPEFLYGFTMSIRRVIF